MFRGKQEREVMDNYKKHIDKALEAINLLQEQVNAIIKGDYNEALRIHKKICDIEGDADVIRRKNERLFAEGILFPSERTFFLTLAEKIDLVIDKTKQASRRLIIRKLDEGGREFLNNSKIHDYLKVTVEAVKKLHDAAEKLLTEPMEALEIAHEVEKYEEMADDYKLEILKDLYSKENTMSPITVFQLDHTIRRIDDISDFAEDASDVIVLIVAGLQP